jgi:hypothetical protein
LPSHLAPLIFTAKITLLKLVTKTLLLSFFCVGCWQAHAQSTTQPVGARYLSMGAYSKKFVDAFSAMSNQAALAQIKSTSAGIYGERRFLQEDINHYTAVAVLPTASGTFGLKADYFGSSSFNESEIGLGYGRSLGRFLDLGVKFNYHSIAAQGNGSAGTVAVELGAVAHLTQQLHAGVHLYNFMQATLGKTEEPLGAVYRLGLGYEASEQLLLSLEMIKEENRPASANIGLQYQFMPEFFVRGGIASATENYFLGVGTRLSSFRFDLSASYHPVLGWTPGIMFLFDLSQSKK